MGSGKIGQERGRGRGGPKRGWRRSEKTLQTFPVKEWQKIVLSLIVGNLPPPGRAREEKMKVTSQRRRGERWKA